MSRVCKRWYQIITLDSLWSEAFQTKWGALPTTPCLFKTSKDGDKIAFWRQEYLLRQKIESVWKYGALQAVSFDSTVGSFIDSLNFSACGNGILESFPKKFSRLSWSAVLKSNPKLIASSKESGMIVNCTPRTGKIEHTILKVCKADEEELDATDTVACISNASVGMNISWILGSKLDGSIMACLQTFNGVQAFATLELGLGEVCDKLFHYVDRESERHGPLHSIFKSNHLFFLSAGLDGRAAMYSTLFPSKALVLFEGNEEPISCISVVDDMCVAGTHSGKIIFWKFPIRSLLLAFQNSDIFEPVKESVSNSMMHPTDPSSIMKIFHDTLTKTLIVQQNNGCIFSSSSKEIGLTKPVLLDNIHHIQQNLTISSFQASSKATASGLLATGYRSGLILIWKVRQKQPFAIISILKDQRNSISSIHLSLFLLATGSDDGSVFIYDTVGFKMLRGLNNKHRNQSVLQDRFRVNQIVNYGFMLCICQSQGISSWTLRPKQEKAPRKAPSIKVPISYSKALHGPASSRSRQDVEYDIEQTMRTLETRRRSLMHEKNLVNTTNGSVKNHEMSEQELLEYAKVLSVHEPGSSLPLGASESYEGDLNETEALELAMALSLSEV